MANSGDPGRFPRPALFLDRDGVLNVDRGYVARIEDFEWIPGAAETISEFNAMGWWVFLVTNQTGIAHGLYTEADMQAVHDWMTAELAEKGARIDRIYHCPFHEDGSVAAFRRASYDRKPRPGMLMRAMTDFPVIRERSIMIGDKPADIEAAKGAGVQGFLFAGGDLHTFARWALADMESGR